MKMVAESVITPTGQVLFKTSYAPDFKVSVSDIKGEVVARTLELNDFKKLLAMSEKPVESWCHVPKGFFPGTDNDTFLDGWISPESWSVVWKVKGAVRQFVHTSGHYRIPFPDILFYVRKGEKYAGDKYAFVIDEKNNLFQYPFGNVSTNGSICMGNISLKDISTVMDFSDEFFLGKTNNDYFHPGDHVKPKYTQTELLRKLDGKDKFPKRWLIKAQVSLQDVINMADPTTRDYRY